MRARSHGCLQGIGIGKQKKSPQIKLLAFTIKTIVFKIIFAVVLMNIRIRLSIAVDLICLNSTLKGKAQAKVLLAPEWQWESGQCNGFKGTLKKIKNPSYHFKILFCYMRNEYIMQTKLSTVISCYTFFSLDGTWMFNFCFILFSKEKFTTL